MADLADAITAGITRREPVNEHSSLADILTELERAAGSGKGAASALGISPTTFYRWRNHATGKTQGVSQAPKASRRAMVAAARRLSLSSSTERMIRRGDLKLVINGMVVVSNDKRKTPRTLDVGRQIPDRKMGNVLSAWLAGDDDRMERLLYRHIEAHYVAGMEFDSINWAEFQS